MVHTNITGKSAGACVTALTALVLLLGCGGATGPSDSGAPPPDPRTVDATPSLAFTPASLTVTAGDNVTFAFGSIAHDVYFDAKTGAPADIPGSNAGVSISRVFSTAGTFTYTCHIHPFMKGAVVVQAPAAGNIAGRG